MLQPGSSLTIRRRRRAGRKSWFGSVPQKGERCQKDSGLKHRKKKTTSIQLHHFKLGLVFPLLHLAGLGVQVVKAKWSAVSSCSMLKMHSVWFPEAIPLLLDLKLFHLRATVNETGLDHSHHR